MVWLSRVHALKELGVSAHDRMLFWGLGFRVFDPTWG